MTTVGDVLDPKVSHTLRLLVLTKRLIILSQIISVGTKTLNRNLAAVVAKHCGNSSASSGSLAAASYKPQDLPCESALVNSHL